MNRSNITTTDKTDTRVSNSLTKKRKHKVYTNSLKKKQKITSGDVSTSNEPISRDYRNYTPILSKMRRSRSKQTQDDPFTNMDHWRNESIYTNPANVHNWSANAHTDYKLNQTYTNSGYRAQQHDQNFQRGGFQAENNGNTATSWRSDGYNAFQNVGSWNSSKQSKSKSKKSNRMVVNPFALNLKETQVVNESSSDDEQPLQHISRNRNSKIQRKENAKLVRDGLKKFNESKNLQWISDSYKKPETVVSNSQNDFQKAFPHFTSCGSSWQDENVEYDRLFLLLKPDFLLETLRTYLFFLKDEDAKILDFTELSDDIERNFVYFLNGNENQNVKSRLCGESQDMYQEILDLLEAKKDTYHILSGWNTNEKQTRTVIYTKVPYNSNQKQSKGRATLHTARTTRRTQPGTNNLTGIEFVGGNGNTDVGISGANEISETVPEEISSANTFKANDPNNLLNENRRGLGKPMNKLLDGLNTPVECSRAERMMHLMGWSGGALGAKGNGITEPIKPNLSMVKGRGLGHEDAPNKNLRTKTPDPKSGSNTPHRSLTRTTRSHNNSLTREKQNQTSKVSDEKNMTRQKMKQEEARARRMKREEARALKKLAKLAKEKTDNEDATEDGGDFARKDKKELTREYFRESREKEKKFKTKALELILEFLASDCDETACDVSLHDAERKCVHTLVASIRSGKKNDSKDDEKQRNLRSEIKKYDTRELFAQSQNVNGKRQLHLYKSHVPDTRVVQRADIFQAKTHKFDASEIESVRVKLLELLAEFLESGKAQVMKFSSQFKKKEAVHIRAVLRDLTRGLRSTKTLKGEKNVPCSQQEIHILDRIYDNPNMQLDFSGFSFTAVCKRMGSIAKKMRTNTVEVSKNTGKSTSQLSENVSSDDSNEVIQNIRKKILSKTHQIDPTESDLFVIDTNDSDNEYLATKKHNDTVTRTQDTKEPTDTNVFVIDKFHSDNESTASKIDADSDDCVCTTKDPELIDIAGDSDSYSEKASPQNQTTFSNNSSDVEICEEIVTPILISSSSDSDTNHDAPVKPMYQGIEEYLDMSDSELKFSFKADPNLNLSESDSEESKDKVSDLKLNDCVILSDTESNAMDCILEAQVEVNIIEGDFNSETETNKEVNALDSDTETAQNQESNSETAMEEVRNAKNDSEGEDNLIIDESDLELNSDLDKSIDVTGNSDLKSDEIDVLNTSNNEPSENIVPDSLLNLDEVDLIQSVLDSNVMRYDVETNAKSDFNDDTLISDLKSELESEAIHNRNAESELKSAVGTISNYKSHSESHQQSQGVINVKSQYECGGRVSSTDTVSSTDAVSSTDKTTTEDTILHHEDNFDLSNLVTSTCNITGGDNEESPDLEFDSKPGDQTVSSDYDVVADSNDSFV